MNRKASSGKKPRPVTKSIRLTQAEAEELGHLVEGTAYAEAVLMRQWVLAGMQQFRVVGAINAYQEGRAEVPHAAEQARLPVAVFLEEMAARKVAFLDQADAFGPGLEALRQTFGNKPARR